MKFKKPIEVQAGISDGDPTNPLGISGYLLSSDGSNVNWVSPGGLSAETAESIVQPIKANEALVKGDPVYIVGFNNGQNVNIVAKADSSDVAKMPVVGLVDDDYANNAFGTMTAFGSFNGNFDTTGGTESWAVGDIIFVKPGGGLTNIKPGGTDLIQNVAIVSRVNQNTGELEVIALGRTNDVPNLPTGRLFVGTAANTSLTSDVVYVDDANDRVGIGTTSPSTKLHVSGNLRLGTTGTFIISQSPFTTTTFYANAGNGSAIIFGAPAAYQQNVTVQGDLSTAGGSTSSYLGTKVFGSFNNRLDPSGDNYLNSGNLGIGTTSPGEKLEVAGSVKATASTDAYKGYIKQSIACGAAEKSATANYNLIPYNTLSTTTSNQYYNRMVAAYDGRIKKVYIRDTGGNTPTASVVNIKKQVNDATSSTVYSTTVTGSGAGMSAVRDFADNDFTFSAGDSFGILYQTTDSGGGAQTMGGVAINIIIEYNIT